VDALSQHPRLREVLVSAAILLGSYLAARLLSFVFARILTKAAERTSTTLDDRLIAALQRPLTYALFLSGAWGAIHRLPLPALWSDRIDQLLFVTAALVITYALVRAYGIVVQWYTKESKAATVDGIAAEMGPLVSKLGKTFLAILALTTILQHLGVNVASLVVSLGVGSLAIGLAAQDTLSNMFAGFTLMADRPFRIGDRIQLATGEVGDVELVGMRATRIRTPDETLLVVPNSLLIKDRLVNLSRPTRHVTTRLEVGVAYGSDLEQVARILKDAALAAPHVDHEREPVVLIARFGELAVHFQLIFWARDYLEQGVARSEAHFEVYRRLAQAGIEIPLVPSRVINPGGTPGAA
jgi:MscS family membrane protein